MKLEQNKSMGSRSESRQETEGSTEKVVFEMRIAIWLGLWHLEGLTQGYSKQRGQNLQRCKTDSGASSGFSSVGPVSPEDNDKRGVARTEALRQGEDGLLSLPALFTLYTFPHCPHTVQPGRTVGYVRIHFML